MLPSSEEQGKALVCRLLSTIVQRKHGAGNVHRVVNTFVLSFRRKHNYTRVFVYQHAKKYI